MEAARWDEAGVETAEPAWIAGARMSLREAVAEAVSTGGSGFRRHLGLGAGRACQLRERDAIELADAVEYFHQASLIFDDLPCMDDATERRGRPCLHLTAGEDQALLAALALVNRSYVGCWRVASEYPERASAAAKLVERCMGEAGILRGQSRDLSFRRGTGAREVRAIAIEKTGMLLKLSLLLPAVLARRPLSELVRLARLARVWGAAYQALDDFGDLMLVSEATSKTPYRDLALERPNIVFALGLEPSLARLRADLDIARRQIAGLIREASAWAFLSDFQIRLESKAEAVRSEIEAA